MEYLPLAVIQLPLITCQWELGPLSKLSEKGRAIEGVGDNIGTGEAGGLVGAGGCVAVLITIGCFVGGIVGLAGI